MINLATLNNAIAKSGGTSFVPSIANGLVIGNGTMTGKMTTVGKRVTGEILVTLGSTSSISGYVAFNYPVGGSQGSGECFFLDTGSQYFPGFLLVSGLIYVCYLNTSGGVVTIPLISATTPFTWTTGDRIEVYFSYEKN